MLNKFIQKVERDTGLFKKNLELTKPRLVYNEEEIEVELLNKLDKYEITSEYSLVLDFNIKCKMEFEDSLIEVDLEMTHGQRLSLHFRKNCYKEHEDKV